VPPTARPPGGWPHPLQHTDVLRVREHYWTWICPKWHPILFIVQYFWPGPILCHPYVPMALSLWHWADIAWHWTVIS
jgi:hypothetical protein